MVTSNLPDDIFNAVTATEESNAAERRRFENYDTDSTVDDPNEAPVDVHDDIQIDNFLNDAVIWVALPDVADTQVDRLLQAELSVK